MGRRKRSKDPIHSLTARHLMSDPADATQYFFDPRNSHRIAPRHQVVELGYFTIPPHRFDPDRFSKDLDQFGPGTAVIADSNIYLAETAPCIWNALFRNRQLLMIQPVAQEIEYWLHDPRGINVDAHRVVQGARELTNNLVSKFELIDQRPDLEFAANWYVNLLSIRKNIRTGVRHELHETSGIPPTNASVNDVVRKRFGERAQRLAISGDGKGRSEHRCNDEAIVVLAIVYALLSRRNTILITHDENVFEQFRRACWIVDTHYRAMRLAAIYARDPFAFMPKKRASDVDESTQSVLAEAFEGNDVTLLRKPSPHLREILPPRRTLVPIHCCLIRNLVEIVTFGLIAEQIELIEMKLKTFGRNTDALGDMNCHIELGPLAHQIGNWAAIGRDRIVTKEQYSYSLIDLNLIVGEHESFIRLLPTRIMMPE